MKKFILSCILVSLVACSSPLELSNPPPSSEPSAPTTPEEQPAPSTPEPSTPEPSEAYRGEAVRTFEGKLEDYSLGKAILKGYRSDYPSYSSSNTIGLGQIEADGSFTFEFKEAVEEMGTTSFICREDLFSETKTGIRVASASQIFIQRYENPSYGSIYGSMVFATSEPDWYFGSSTPENGDKIMSWEYAFEDSELTRTCDNGLTFDISLKTGWNTVAGLVDESGVRFEMAGITDDNLAWFFIPPEVQEEPEPPESPDDGDEDEAPEDTGPPGGGPEGPDDPDNG